MWHSLCTAQPSRAVTRFHPASSPPRPPASPSAALGRARFCPQFHSRVTESTLVGATSCRGTGHTAETREGFYCGFLRVLSSWRGERAGAFPVPSQHEWITYLPAWPAPGGFPRRGAPAATRPAPVQPAGRARHAGTCSSPRARAGRGRVGVAAGPPGRSEAGKWRDGKGPGRAWECKGGRS